MEKVRVGSGWDMDRRIRQHIAFRARILQKYHALELLVQLQNEGLVQRKARIAELEEQVGLETYRYVELASIYDKDQKRIAELEGELDWANGIIEQMVAKLAEKDKEIIEKDEEIRMLEETIREMRGFL